MAMDMMSFPWLERLLSITIFFTVCKVHPHKPRSQLNYFCLECDDNPLCNSCCKTSHKDHKVIQIRRSSHKTNEVVKTGEIYKLVDILGIQSYTINSIMVVFINRDKPDPNGRKKQYSNYNCKTCERNLMESSWFCSMACKFEYVKKEGGFVVTREEKENMKRLLKKYIDPSEFEEMSESSSDEENLKRKTDEAGIDEENEGGEDGEVKEELPVVIRPSASFRKPNSRRKGIPYRAPFF